MSGWGPNLRQLSYQIEPADNAVPKAKSLSLNFHIDYCRPRLRRIALLCIEPPEPSVQCCTYRCIVQTYWRTSLQVLHRWRETCERKFGTTGDENYLFGDTAHLKIPGIARISFLSTFGKFLIQICLLTGTNRPIFNTGTSVLSHCWLLYGL